MVDNAEDWEVNVSGSYRLDTPILFDYVDSPYNPLTPLNMTEFVSLHENDDTVRNICGGMDTASASTIYQELSVNDTNTTATSLLPQVDNDSFLRSKVLIDLPDLGVLDDLIIDSPDRNNSYNDENACSVKSYLRRILQELAEVNARVDGLRSEFTISSESNRGANLDAIAGLNETMRVQLKELTDKYTADRILEKSYSLDVQTIKELLASQGARLEAVESNAGHVIGRTATTDAAVENIPVVIPGDNSHQQQPPMNNVEQINENDVIECPPQSQNMQSSQPSTSRLSLSATFRALRDISNNQLVSSVPILQNQKHEPRSRDDEGGRAKRTRITVNNETTGTSSGASRRQTCSKCFRVLDKYYLKKLNGHRKHCKPRVSL